MLAVLPVSAVFILALLGLMQTAPLFGQVLHTEGPLPAFEVASIRTDHSGPGPSMILAAGHGAPKDRFIATNITIKALICWAFGGTSVPLPNNEVSGGPSWINSERYDIDAKLDDSQAVALDRLSSIDQIVQLRLTVQSLLADRFKLVADDTTVTRPIFTLVIAKSGSKLLEAAPGTESEFSGGRGELKGHGIPMSLLVRFLSQRLGRPVVDKTGLRGNYELELKWTPNLDSGEMMQGPSSGTESAPPDSSGPSIFAAIQEQLGLKLNATNGPAEALKIVRIEKPSEN